MYEWRKLGPVERKELLARRKARRQPWHSIPHGAAVKGSFHLSAACYEHKPIIGYSPQRMEEFERLLLEAVSRDATEIFAWCVLPNHYHLLISAENSMDVLRAIGRFHGRQSFSWNGEEGTRGRKVWSGCVERAIRSERHFWAALNYIHHNPVRHGYVEAWQDWPYSSAGGFMERVGRREAELIWKQYPILNYGKGWDEPDL
ncbi:MAG: transposase [bacterium]